MTDKNGFPIEYRDWNRVGFEDGEAYEVFMFEIEGDGWMEKYNPIVDNPSDSRDSVFGINMIGF